ncbi:Leucine-rich repeat-containing G-protein coupled receptor 5 [Papilio xuthus]|uniref:Leucine-rich repeat-containing G-protein coupled receptor 5 n=1 Tax=Papilio xuthus TaxID=66420 RepID=A0A194PII7_PAPXU|nr:Leucine-rich repeat-containing G-protein coupled receptor 5 [Papilio xuthus]
MRAIIILTFNFLILNVNGQEVDADGVTEEVQKLIKLCSFCTCSEIPEIDGTHLVFNILCSELDRIQNVADLDKIQWPENPNGLKISAAFEGLGLNTLGRLPPNAQVETLRFSNNAIKTYWPDPFSDVPNLKRLSFSQNELMEITPDLFTNIEHLEELDLSYNKLTDFNSLDFKFLRNLKRLNLQSNLIKKMPIEVLSPMILLEDLDLSKNGIYDLLLQKTESEPFKVVKRLSLSGNRIRSVTKESFPLNNSIELLDLSNNVIEIIEENAFLTCVNLRELNLGQNNITFTFALPPSLQIAILKINTLYHWPTFPDGITYIDLSYNRLSDMYNENQVEFENLEILNIGGNQIKDINIEKKLPKLYSLDISYNLIKDIPKCLSSQILPKLEELRLDGNPIEDVYFKNILSLKNLYLNDMHKLVTVKDKAFSNVIGRGDETMNERNCFYLYMSNCGSLSEIQDGAFDATSLCMIDISKNNLTRLSKDLLDWRALTEGADLQYNPWECSCPLQWMLDDLLPTLYKSNSRLLTELRCGSPRGYEGLRLVHWYNWTEPAMCSDMMMRAGPHGTYILQPSTDSGPKFNYMIIILVACISVALLIAVALFVYLVRNRRRHRVRQAALKRKRQTASDIKNSNGLQKEKFGAFNKA